MDGEVVKVVSAKRQPSPGAGGVPSILPGCPATVSALSDVEGGIRGGAIVESDCK